MQRSVVTHHRTAGWRSHWATSRWTAGRVRRRRSGRGGTRGAGAHLQPGQGALRPHHRDGMPVAAGPQAALVQGPAPLPVGCFRARRDGRAPMGLAGPRLQRGRGRQGAPVVLPPLGLAPRRALAYQPAEVPLAVAGEAPAAHRDDRVAPPACGALTPADGAPLPAGQGLEPPSGSGPRAGGLPLATAPAVGPPTTSRACRASKPARKWGWSPASASATPPCWGTRHARA
jgi:hypothetical protein